MLSLSLGPFALSTAHVLTLTALGLAMLAARRAAPERGKARIESLLFWLFALGVISARLGFVAAYWTQYRNAPWQMLDLRDGGFMPGVGLATGLSVAAIGAWRARHLRRPLAWGLSVGLALWLGGHALLSWQRQGATLPSVTFADGQGAPVALGRFKGQPMVVNLWASWCPPCRREMPALVAAQHQRPDLRFLYVNQGEAAAMSAGFLGATGVNPADVFYDARSELGRAVGAMALPTTLFYSADGRLLGSHLGELSPASLAHALEVFGAEDQ